MRQLMVRLCTRFAIIDREAASFVEAVQSAIDAIECIQGLKVVRITGDNAQQIAKFIPQNILIERAETTRPDEDYRGHAGTAD